MINYEQFNYCLKNLNFHMNNQDQSVQLQNQLIQAIYDSLQNHIPSNATFLAQRLVAERDSQQYRNILAQSYLNQNKPNKAYYILKDCKSQQNKYKFALSCIKINKLKEAQKALISADPNSKNNQNKYDQVPNGSYGLYLLGMIYQKQQRYQQCKQAYLKALQLNPILWSAYERLMKLGQNILPNKIFTQNKFKIYENNRKSHNFNTTLYKSLIKTKQETKVPVQSDIISNLRSKKPSNIPTSFTSIPIKKKINEKQNQNIMVLLKKFADPLYNSTHYNCLQAIQQFKKLPSNHLNTGWVLTNIGKCYMEIVKYIEAQKYFQESYKIQPYRLQGLQYYSSCLWHLKKQVQLCSLAHSALQKSLYAPETWIAVGNCFSLQKQHEHALKFFLRAIQLNTHNPYAYSLCGHQYVYNEDFIKARKMFENALNLDMRHYNAWWGIGNIAYKQQKYQKAIQSFGKSININPKNPILYSFMGMAYAAKRDFATSLKYFQKSEEIDPNNGLNRFQKANALVKLEKYQIAIEQLQKLQAILPKEAPIPTLLGKIYKKLGKIDKAHFYFTTALDLQNKDNQKIKGFIQNLHNTGSEFEQMD